MAAPCRRRVSLVSATINLYRLVLLFVAGGCLGERPLTPSAGVRCVLGALLLDEDAAAHFGSEPRARDCCCGDALGRGAQLRQARRSSQRSLACGRVQHGGGPARCFTPACFQARQCSLSRLDLAAKPGQQSTVGNWLALTAGLPV